MVVLSKDNVFKRTVRVNNKMIKLYYNPKAIYDTSSKGINDFEDYDDNFNKIAGIYELDKSLKYLQEKLQQALDDIANDEEVTIAF